MKVKVTKDLKTCIVIISAIILLFIVSFILFAVKLFEKVFSPAILCAEDKSTLVFKAVFITLF